MTTCYTSRFLLFALLLYSSSDVISALLFRGELGSCLSVPSSNPSPVGDELRRLSVDVKRAVVASILSCPEFLAFSSARTRAKGKYTNTQLNKPVSHISEYNVAITPQKIQLRTKSTQICTGQGCALASRAWWPLRVVNGTSKTVGLRKFWQDLEISEAFLISLEVSFLHGLFLLFLSLETFYQKVSDSDF